MLYWLWAIPVLAVIILAHEAGHLLAARWAGVRILEFGIGLPPRLARLGERNGVVYSLNWLPVGGFVALAGEDDDGIRGGLAAQPPGRRAVVLAAGAMMNLALALAIFTALALLPHEVPAQGRIGVIGIIPGSPAHEAGLRGRDILLSVNGKPVRDQTVLLDLSLLGGQETTLVVERAGAVLTLTVVPSVSPVHEVDYLGVSRYLLESPLAELTRVVPDRPAHAAGLRAGDVVVSLNGRPVQSAIDFWERLYTERQEWTPLVFGVLREGQVLPPITVYPPPPQAEDQTIGVGWGVTNKIVQLAPLEALLQGGRDTAEAIVLVPRVLRAIFRGSVPASDLAGPVGIVQATAQVAQARRLEGVARFAAMLSANVFVVNLLPLPALDGGRLAFVLLEVIARRRIPSRLERRIHRWGMYLLLAVLAVVTIFDLLRILRPRP